MKIRKTVALICAALILSGCTETVETEIGRQEAETSKAAEKTTSGAPAPVGIEEEADPETDAEDFETAEEDGGLVIVRYTGEAPDIVIPAGIGEKAVVGIGADAFRKNTALERVTIPEGVVSIGKEAFFGCMGLMEAVLPDSVASIGDGAFMGCDKLESVTFPNRAVEMGRNLFSGNLIDAESPDPCPWICKMREENPLVIVNGNLLDATKCDGEIVVPDGVLSICPSAFSEMGLNVRPTSVRLPDGITRIPAGLFQGCRSMESVTIPESVTEIGEDAFYDCQSLTRLDLPDGLEKLGGSIFSPFDYCEVVYRSETYSSERYEALYALFENDSAEGESAPPSEPYIAPDGEALTAEDASYTDREYMHFPFAYITYVQAGELVDLDGPKTKVRIGEVLDNGLTVVSASTVVRNVEWGYDLGESNAAFEGELTLTGTLRCMWEEDPIDPVSGLLFFSAGPDQGIKLPFGLLDGLFQEYRLGSIYDDGQPEGILEMFDHGEKDEVRVEVTLRDIRVYHEEWKTGSPDSAVLVAVTEIEGSAAQ